MSETEIVEYLLRWLMEFGPEPVSNSVRWNNRWYTQNETPTADVEELKAYFQWHGMKAERGIGECSITPEGYELLENYHESNH